MGEAFLVQKNAAIKTPDPTVNLTSINFTSINVRLTNNHDRTVTMYYELDNALPNANTITVGANSFEDITLSSLSSNTAFTFYVYAKEDGQLPSDTLDAQFTTLTYTTQAPSINVTETTADSVTFTLTNNDTSTVTMYYEVNDSTPDITATVSGGATITRTIGSLTEGTNYTLYARAQASNENMSGTVSQQFTAELTIVTNGLLMYLDAGVEESYSGSGSTWYDLSGNNYNANISGNTRFSFQDGGKFDYRGISTTSDYITLNSSVLNTLNNGIYTIIFWYQHDSSNSGRYFHSIATSSSDNGQILAANSNTIGSWNGGGTISVSDNQWYQIAVVRNGSSSGTLYRNFDVSTSATLLDTGGISTSWILNQEQDSFGGGFTSTQNVYAAFKGVLVYNRALSQGELEQNYNLMNYRIQSSPSIPPGTQESVPAISAQQIQSAGITTNGNYWLKPNGYSGSAFQVYIDFDGSASGISDAGPWMRVEYSSDRYSQSSPWAGTGDSQRTNNIEYSGDFSFTKTDAQIQAIINISTEARQKLPTYGYGSVGWLYGRNNSTNDYQGAKAFNGSTYRGNGSSDNSNLIYSNRPSNISYSFSNLNTFNNPTSDPTDANDQTWRNGTTYIRETSANGILPLRGIYNADVDGSTERRYFPLASENGYTWFK